MSKIGIYSGVFDPIHDGHIAFAREVVAAGKVDAVYFMLEVRPRRKHGVTDAAHRRAMLEAAVLSEPDLALLESTQPTLSVRDTLPMLQGQFPQAQLCLMMGSDLFASIEAWPDYPALRRTVSFGVAIRGGQKIDSSKLTSEDWVINSPLPEVASSRIRSGTSQHIQPAVAAYMRAHQLYKY